MRYRVLWAPPPALSRPPMPSCTSHPGTSLMLAIRYVTQTEQTYVNWLHASQLEAQSMRAAIYVPHT
ncbi:MAG: hypothetical protein ACK55Z_02755, partial [bacterium]